ncbi:hypothetical protein ANN_11798 [Periplaneta americana]|uniref:Uncharacterized protein n=1 Tax=Periplaneta americana TaxID=6978 RepID=A0ABQ8T7U2_PERAM|nr:hypothetical protein ANN_11798 [Periplaneta americana]
MVASGVAGITSSSNVSHTSSTPSSGTSNIPIPLTSSRREWEPGIRVRRKLQSHTSAKESEISVSSLASNRGRVSKTTAVHTQQPKSGEGINSGSGTSSAGSSAVQDSGFGTETSSSKEHCHSSSSSSTTTGPVVVHRPGSSTTAAATSSTVLDEAEDELWNLLDVIHRKGTKLREEVEHLQQRFQASDRLGMIGHKEGEGVLRRRSLGDIEQQLIQESGKFCTSEERERRLRILKTGRSRKALLGIEGGSLHDDFRKGHMMEKLDSNREARSEDEIRSLQRERDLLLDKVAEMEAETLASRARASQLQTELGCLIEAKRDLEEQLRAAVSQKSELNSRIHDLHMQFVGANKNGGSSSSYSPLSDATARKLLLVPGAKKPLVANHASQERLRNVVSSQAAYGRGSSPGRGQSCFTPVPLTSRRFSEGATSIKTSDEKTITSSHLSSHSQDGGTSLSRQESEDGVDRVKSESQSAEEESGRPRFKLGTLDGIVSSPSRIARTTHGVKPDPLKVAAILQEFSAVELQRHLLTTSVENKALHQRLERTVKSHVDLVEQLEKIKDENDDLKFQESGTSITDVHISLDDTTEQQGDTYPDSLNHLSSQESSPTAFKLSTNIVTSNNSVSSEQQNSVYQTSETQAFPWHSSSSEYFDSINNSGSAVFQNSSILRSFSFYQDQYLQSSAQGEALAECDSLEKEAVGVELNNIIADSGNDSSNFVVSSTSSRKLWVKTDNPSECVSFIYDKKYTRQYFMRDSSNINFVNTEGFIKVASAEDGGC